MSYILEKINNQTCKEPEHHSHRELQFSTVQLPTYIDLTLCFFWCSGKMPDTSSDSRNSITAVDPTEHLPLSLHGSEVIPPAPNRSISSIDWLPDFAGYSWVAYGASSLLVISHFPSALSPEETSIGPIFRQVFQLCGDVSSVSWSQVMPSIGELAAASENCVSVFSHDSAKSKGMLEVGV